MSDTFLPWMSTTIKLPLYSCVAEGAGQALAGARGPRAPQPAFLDANHE